MPEYDIELSEEAPPDPVATIETLSALGYSTESAVADLIDNSITAGATRVDVFLHWEGADSWCAVADNGRGMNGDELKQAMTIGSRDPVLPRDKTDLGRFGFGLKTASFSQCRELTVGSKRTNKRFAYRTWDLDYVRTNGRWLLIKSPPLGAQQLIEQCQRSDTKTVVLWRRLTGDLVEEEAEVVDRRAHQRFLHRVTSLEGHLGMTFGRFLRREKRPLQIYLNENPVVGWDPFLTDHSATQPLPTERVSLRNEKVVVSPFVLPHSSKLSDAEYNLAGGRDGWDTHQGFYVYRYDRLIQAGGWFNRGHRREADYNLARIAVDVPATLDRDWALDVKKAFVRPPGPLTGDLKRIAQATRKRAREVYRHRGTQVGRRTAQPVYPVWRQLQRHGETIFRVNLQHPVIAELLEKSEAGPQDIRDLIRVIEDTVPVPLLPGRRPEGSQPTTDAKPDKEIEAVVERIYESLLLKGFTRQAAKDRLSKMEPFNLYPDLIEQLVGSK